MRPTTQCHVGLYFLSNYFLMYAAMSFSMLNFSKATLAQSIASCCISSFISACLITAFLSAVDIINSKKLIQPTRAIFQISIKILVTFLIIKLNITLQQIYISNVRKYVKISCFPKSFSFPISCSPL